MAATNDVAQQATAVSTGNTCTNASLDEAFHDITAADDKAHDEIDKWIREEEGFAEKGAGRPQATMSLKIKQRLDEVEKTYQNFVDLHPNYVPARLAFGSFLNDRGDEDNAIIQWEKARELEPQNPAAWNNLGTVYGHHGPVDKAFECFDKAIELRSTESVYYHNLAVHVYLFRKHAQEHYHLTEDQVFEKSLDLYRSAIKLNPTNFFLSCDYAQSFYGTTPPRYKEGLIAWQNSLKLAPNEVEREGIQLHLARIETRLGNLEEARKHLDSVTNSQYDNLKRTLTRNLNEAVQQKADPQSLLKTNSDNSVTTNNSTHTP
jgi:tetratricopeptide (TPR) repeat protein